MKVKSLAGTDKEYRVVLMRRTEGEGIKVHLLPLKGDPEIGKWEQNRIVLSGPPECVLADLPNFLPKEVDC